MWSAVHSPLLNLRPGKVVGTVSFATRTTSHSLGDGPNTAYNL